MTKYGLPEEVLFCKKCVISNQRPSSTIEYSHTTDSKKETIYFDEEGICDACRIAEVKASVDWQGRQKELMKLCDKHRSKGGAFDCVVPGSGGKDSFYAAYVLKHDYGMHPLLVTWAPHIYTDVGWRNLQKWQGISDHILYTPNRNVHRLITRLAVENLFHPFQPFIIGQKSIAAKVAHQYKIPLVFYGESEAEYGNPKSSWKAQRPKGFHTLPHAMSLGGVSLDELQRKYKLTESDLDAYTPLHMDDLDRFSPQIHYLGYYLKWKPQECYYYAAEKSGFECAPERSPGTWSKYNSLDDMMDDFHYYTTFIKFGIGRATYDAAQEIRSGDITREEGVALVHKYDGEYPERYEKEVFEYLSVDGFHKMNRVYFLALCDKFKSEHLWGGDKLRYEVE
jgi:N-acetyl sugar amidotransferase